MKIDMRGTRVQGRVYILLLQQMNPWVMQIQYRLEKVGILLTTNLVVLKKAELWQEMGLFLKPFRAKIMHRHFRQGDHKSNLRSSLQGQLSTLSPVEAIL